MSSKELIANNYLSDLSILLSKINIKDIVEFHSIIREKPDNRIFVFGNGGSASTASHMVVDFVKSIGWPFFCLNDNIPSVTAISNDFNYSQVFSKQLSVLATPGDIAIGISGSGNSENITEAFKVARYLDMKTLSLTGFDGGRVARLSDLSIIVPSDNMQYIEDCHLAIIHILYKMSL